MRCFGQLRHCATALRHETPRLDSSPQHSLPPSSREQSRPVVISRILNKDDWCLRELEKSTSQSFIPQLGIGNKARELCLATRKNPPDTLLPVDTFKQTLPLELAEVCLRMCSAGLSSLSEREQRLHWGP